MTWTRAATAAILAGFTTVWFGSILAGGSLVPDTSEFASGHASWSSPILSLSGALAGLTGVRLVALAALLTLSVCVYSFTASMPGFGLLLSLVLALGPWSNALGCAGADALGTVTLAVLVRRSRRLGPLAAAAHLASGLAALAALVLVRLTRASWPFAVGLACVFELVVLRTRGLGLLPSSGLRTELQWRYMLPLLVSFFPSASEALPEPKASSGEAASLTALAPATLSERRQLGHRASGVCSRGLAHVRDGLSAVLVTDGVNVRPAVHAQAITRAPHNVKEAASHGDLLLSDHRIHPGDADSRGA